MLHDLLRCVMSLMLEWHQRPCLLLALRVSQLTCHCALQAWHQQQHAQQPQQQQQMQSAASGGMQYPMYVPQQPQQMYSGYGQYSAPMTYPPQNMVGDYGANAQPQTASQHQHQHQQQPPLPPAQQYQPLQAALQQPAPYGMPAQSFPQYGAVPSPPMPQYPPQGPPAYAPYAGASHPGSDLVMGYPQGAPAGYAGGYPGMPPVPPPQPMGAPPPYRPLSGQQPGSQAQQLVLSPPPVPVKRPITIQAPPGSEGGGAHGGTAQSAAVPLGNGQQMGGGRRYSAMTGNLQ